MYVHFVPPQDVAPPLQQGLRCQFLTAIFANMTFHQKITGFSCDMLSKVALIYLIAVTKGFRGYRCKGLWMIMGLK